MELVSGVSTNPGRGGFSLALMSRRIELMKITQQHLQFWMEHNIKSPKWSNHLTIRPVSIHRLIPTEKFTGDYAHTYTAHNLLIGLKRARAKGDLVATLQQWAKRYRSMDGKRVMAYCRKWARRIENGNN